MLLSASVTAAVAANRSSRLFFFSPSTLLLYRSVAIDTQRKLRYQLSLPIDALACPPLGAAPFPRRLLFRLLHLAASPLLATSMVAAPPELIQLGVLSALQDSHRYVVALRSWTNPADHSSILIYRPPVPPGTPDTAQRWYSIANECPHLGLPLEGVFFPFSYSLSQANPLLS